MALQSITALATITLQAAASEVTFSGIPNTYRDLVLVSNPKATVTVDNMRIQFNSDGASSYSWVIMRGNGSTPSSASTAATYLIADLLPVGVEADLGQIYRIQIMDYSATDKHKTILDRYDDASQNVGAIAGRWASTDAIHTIKLYINGTTLAAGSTFSLYGRIA